MKKRTLQQLQTGLPWLLVGILLTILWQSQGVEASPPLKPLQVGPPPQMMSYQGQVNVGGLPFDGTGSFKFAIVNRLGTTTYWSNDGSSVGGSEPSNAVSLAVDGGLFNVLLGDTSLPNMTLPLVDDVFAETDTFLRIWFDDGVSGFEQLGPDQRIASVAYALRAQYAENAADLQGRVAALEELLVHFSRDGNDVTISGANLHVVNGLGSTDTSNQWGNVIIGYNEPRTFPGAVNDRSGSHMLVVGSEHNYSSYGGIVVGLRNTTSGDFASVSGGEDNTASGDWSSISGGEDNTASGDNASISGGLFTEAHGDWSSVSGGNANFAIGLYSSVSGGVFNEAHGDWSSVSGGEDNTASGDQSSVSGGFRRSVGDIHDWRAGDLLEDD